jgi:hypothetical protein
VKSDAGSGQYFAEPPLGDGGPGGEGPGLEPQQQPKQHEPSSLPQVADDAQLQSQLHPPRPGHHCADTLVELSVVACPADPSSERSAERESDMLKAESRSSVLCS